MIRGISGPLGYKLRYLYYKRRLGACGKNVRIDRNVTFTNPEMMFLGNDIWIDNGVILLAGKVSMGRQVALKANKEYEFGRGELHIDDQVHIGPQVIIQAHGGCHIGSKLTIGAGSKIYTLSHHHRNLMDKSDTTRYNFGSMVPEEEQFLIESPVVVRKRAAVGINCVLLPGTYIPEGTWIGVGLIVKSNNLTLGRIYRSSDELKSDGDK
jgi:acetyltransferase-like isoleucine patch superfamily enzyme